MDAEHRSPLRLLAPAAVVVFGLVLILVIATTGGSSKGGGKASSTLEQKDLGTARKGRQGRHNARALPQNVYIVKRNDTFGSIADKTGVPVDTLQQLNPDVDPQTLHEGQKIKLR